MNNYELPPNPPNLGSGVELSPTEKMNQLLINMLETSSCIDKIEEESKTEELLCPFRKSTVFMDCDEKHSWPTLFSQAYYMEEDFLPCLKEKCMMWHGRTDNTGYCRRQK